MGLPSSESTKPLGTLPTLLQLQEGWSMQKSKSDWTLLPNAMRPRGFSDSKVKDFPSSSSHSLSRVTSTTTVQPTTLDPPATVLPSSSFANRVGDALRSSSRDRSLSVGRVVELGGKIGISAIDISASGSPGLWWSPVRREATARPWNDKMESDRVIPDEQMENWEQTRKVGVHLSTEKLRS